MAERREKPVPDLKRVLREVRIARADQNDVVVDLREAEQARLELLAEALEGVFDGLPQDNEQLLLGILPGPSPRYWVDATSFVALARDKRQYRFVKDTRAGRTVLAESTSVEAIADAVTSYIAERIVEREHAIEADWLTARAEKQTRATPIPADAQNLIWGVSGFALGAVCGMFLLLAYAWFMGG